MQRERTSVGLDVHARSVVACGVDGDTGEMFRARLVPQPEKVLGWLRELPGPVAVVYEAAPTGYGLSRFLTDHGILCVVAAPSTLQRPSGDRVKTDAKDALHLAWLCAWARSSRSRSRAWRRRPLGTWFGPGRMFGAI